MQKFSKVEVNLIIAAMQQRKGGVPRRFEYSKLSQIAEIRRKLGACEDKDGAVTDKEHQMDFTPQEKRTIVGIVQELDWMLGDAPHVLNIVKKLNK